jgi:hypothetical protein
VGPRLFIATVVTALGMACAAGAGAAGLHSTTNGVRFTSKTIVIPRAVVRKNLIGIAGNGTFKFKHAAGALSRLRVGKVMLLQGADAVVVTKVKRQHGALLVTTKAAKVTDVLSRGHVKFSGTPDMRSAVLQKLVVPASGKRAGDFSSPAYPYVGAPPATALAKAAAAPTLSAQGSAGLFGYSLGFTPASPSRLDISGTLCFISGSVCANGPSNGVTAEVNFTGYVDLGHTSGGIAVNGGDVTNSSLTFSSFAVHGHVTYKILRGDGANSNPDPPVFHVPLGVDYTIPGEIPIYLKLQLGLLLKLGVSSKNAVIQGGVDVNTTGSDTITQTGKAVSSSESGDQITGNVLTQSDGGVGASISLAPSGVVVALQFPKVGLGLGFTAANAIAYVDMIDSIGQTVGSALGGMFCSSYDVFVSIGAGLEAQIGLGKLGLGVSSPRKTLFEKQAHTHDPGCPQV